MGQEVTLTDEQGHALKFAVGGGGPITIADGADVTQGSTTGGAWSGTGPATVLSALETIALEVTSPNPTTVVISAGSAAIGSVTLGGQLPAFAATPTINLGTLNGAATAALQSQIDGHLTSTQPRSIASNAPTTVVSAPLLNVNDAVTVACNGMNTVMFSLAATATSGVVTFEGTLDGSTWRSISLAPEGAGPSVTTATANGTVQVFERNVKAYTSMRMRVTTALSASTLGAGNASNGISTVRVGTPSTDPVPVSSAAAASELHLGEVGGNVAKAAVQFGPASSTAYAAGQVLLGTTALASMARVANGTGYLFGAALALNVANTAQVDLFIFSSLPSGTYTAAAAFALASADQAKLSKVIHLDDWTAAGAAVSFGQPLDKGARLFRCDDTTSTQSLWVVAVARGAITLTAATDANLTVRAARN